MWGPNPASPHKRVRTIPPVLHLRCTGGLGDPHNPRSRLPCCGLSMLHPWWDCVHNLHSFLKGAPGLQKEAFPPRGACESPSPGTAAEAPLLGGLQGGGLSTALWSAPEKRGASRRVFGAFRCQRKSHTERGASHAAGHSIWPSTLKSICKTHRCHRGL